MTENIKKIIQKQQALEYLKKQSCTSGSQLQKLHQQATDAYSKYIISQCIRLEHRNQKRRFFASILTTSLLAVVLIWFAGLAKTRIERISISRAPEQTVLPEETTEFYSEDTSNAAIPSEAATNTTDSSETSSAEHSTMKIYKNSNGQIVTTQTLVQDAIKEGNLAKAHQILKDDNMGPDTFAGACTYYDLYVAEENYDLAVNTQLDYLDAFGTQNIRLYSPIYVNLQEAKDFPLSDDTKQRYDAYMKECDESVARFAELDDLIKDKKYEEALEKCNTMKNVNGCTDYLLFYSYRDCYMGLEKYEEFAEYLIARAQEIQKSSDLLFRVSLKFEVEDGLKEIYDNVSPATQEKITALNFIDQDN